ncbi:hypothetical protein KY284_013229 [Solanum tuberosum]|nr:hypothetical protein KY284_013229 [Solanum tuberosum]
MDFLIASFPYNLRSHPPELTPPSPPLLWVVNTVMYAYPLAQLTMVVLDWSA